MSNNVKRLFKEFQPKHYALSLDIDQTTMTFKGTAVITGQKTGRPSQRLTFHQKDLKITAAHVTKHGKTSDEITIDRINCQQSLNELRLHAKHMLYPGQYTITLEFEGRITDNMHGLYP